MDLLQRIARWLNTNVVERGFPVRGENIPFMVVLLLGAGFFLTLYLGFLQLRKLARGFVVTSGMYDDPNEPGDMSHFQALTTALSATVGIGNIAGVAVAIHLGGPGRHSECGSRRPWGWPPSTLRSPWPRGSRMWAPRAAPARGRACGSPGR